MVGLSALHTYSFLDLDNETVSNTFPLTLSTLKRAGYNTLSPLDVTFGVPILIFFVV